MHHAATTVDSPPSLPPGETHRVQLDGLRTFAVLAVMGEHWAHGDWLRFFPGGMAGVRLFFVLSGFLITGILLRARDQANAAGQPVRTTLARFYVRRFLRIFPLYYAAVLLAAMVSSEGRRMLLPNLLYTTNFAQFAAGDWSGCVSHFWSLAVEEQFYLVWPLLILLVPRHRIRAVVWITLLSAPAFRVILLLLKPDLPLVEVLPVSCLDSLGLGAMLAVLRDEQRGMSRGFEWACLIIGLPLWIAFRAGVVARLTMPEAIWTLESTCASLVFTWLIGRAADGFRGPFGHVLSFGPIVYLGTISYGLYVIHLPLIYWKYLWKTDARLLQDIMYWIPSRFLFLLFITVCVASVSWWFYERPINSLKRYWPYVPRKREQSPSAVA